MLDLLITGVSVVDGTGSPAYRAAVGIEGRRIAVIARGSNEGVGTPIAAARTIEAPGRVLAPGFVDVHSHSDMAAFFEPTMPSVIRQGVTTVVVGNCGASPFPSSTLAELASWVGGRDRSGGDPTFASFGAFLDGIERARPAVHIASLVGHGSVRELAMGVDRRRPNVDELAEMRRSVADAIEAGALGVSTGLIYVPGMYSETDEIVSIAQETARAGGIYASHIRGEGSNLFRSVDEALDVGRRSEIPVHVSHLKCETSFVWGRADDLLDTVHHAGATTDQYPYSAWASVLSSLLPEWAPVADLRRLLDDIVLRTRLIASVERGEGEAFQSSVDGVGWDRIVVEATADPSRAGSSIAQIADRRGVEPVEAFFGLLLEDPNTSCIGHAMHEDDVRTIMADPDVMVASDAAAMSPAGPMVGIPVHPRTYGTFPRVIGPSVRDGVLTLEAAVRKMTSLPADRFGLSGRGRIVEGAWADLVVFDPNTVRDQATFELPHAFPEGIEAVIVEGVVAWRADARSERSRSDSPVERAGHVIRRGDM